MALPKVRGIFSHVREYPPCTPKRTQGALPLDPAHWQFVARITARAAQCKCGVHGFAMNLLRVVTGRNRALLREARVTVVGRQTACEVVLLRSP